ncbi:MAG TPA: cytochrome c biogenesis protein CcdA [Bacteroidia bacterium]|jgi:thiol:disulfide interchange protein DsbD|nr:cytochrome c biogenesis protein CcdA [Bacteroidia bacterium]
MRFYYRTLLFLILSVLSVRTVTAQIENPTSWKFTSKKLSDCEYELQITGTIDEHWHVYSLHQTGDGPLATEITFEKSKDYELVGKLTEAKPTTIHDDAFDTEVSFFEKKAVFMQKIKLLTDKAVTVKGNLNFQVCIESKCLPPTDVPLEFKLAGTAACLASSSAIAPSINTGKITDGKTAACVCDSTAIFQALTNQKKGGTSASTPDQTERKPTATTANSSSTVEQKGYWGILIAGFISGLFAIFTPCVFPMIPLTVSFFLKQSKTRSQGIKNALLYGISIIVIYITLGLGVSLIFGSDRLNELSTTVGFNLFFFILLLLFAASFLGAFEIVLPSRFVSKIDAQSDRGGIMGIFFMALTLTVVSFSCTVPVVGSLLVEAAVNGGIKGPLCGMLGFSTALALPFALFALFPTWLNSLPKSGGWLNSVKVFLGFIELAFALKFASNADLAVQAGFLTREIFIALWIVIFALLGAYLMGWFKLAHDSELKSMSVTRLFIAILSFTFTVYMIPGLWGAPLKLINGFTPPDFYSEAPRGFGVVAAPTNATEDHHQENCPNQLPCFHDYDEALAYAKKVNKPLLIDFTGWNCGNCRKMESQVWTDAEVDKRIRNEVVIVSLYVDNKKDLPEQEQTVKKLGDRDFKIKTIGNKWSYFQADRYKTNSQPQYVLVDHKEAMLTKEPRSYNLSIPDYVAWLDEGINEFKSRTTAN